MALTPRIRAAARAIKDAKALLICAGAGIGVDSGLPDFRGNEGFWKAYPLLRDRAFTFADMANPQSFRNDPALAWAFYGHRLKLYRETVPHKGFEVLKGFGESMVDGYFVFTSNVDGQFQKAGFAGDNICEVHGSIHHVQCLEPCCETIRPLEQSEQPEVNMKTFKADMNTVSHCRTCGGIARPNILMFGDYGFLESRTTAQSERMRQWDAKVDPDKLVVIECGAGTAIPTVRYESEMRMAAGATLIRINVRESSIPGVDEDPHQDSTSFESWFAQKSARRGIALPLGAREALEAIQSEVAKL